MTIRVSVPRKKPSLSAIVLKRLKQARQEARRALQSAEVSTMIEWYAQLLWAQEKGTIRTITVDVNEHSEDPLHAAVLVRRTL